MPLTPALKDRLDKLTSQSRIMLFMKGDKFMPRCGFSAQVVDVLNRHQVDYTSFDILEDEEVRAGLKEYSDWPTFPQLYLDGELLGGCDIILEMEESGELADLLAGK